MKELKERLKKLKLVPVINIYDLEKVIPLAETLLLNGLPCAEITFRTEIAAQAISLMKSTYPEMLIGAGTIIKASQVSIAKDVGADFLVSPGLNPLTIQAARDNQMLIIPGINSPSFVEQALSIGIDFVKFYPAEISGGVQMLNALNVVYPIDFMPTGGINPDNLKSYLATKNVIACGGTWLTPDYLVKNNEWHKIGSLIKRALEIADGK